MFFSKKWNPDGLHVYIPGGSSGLGLALAILMVQKGAHVSIVARGQDRLDKALVEMQNHRQNPAQKLNAYSFGLNSAAEASKALEAVCEAHEGHSPDAVFACAGASKPMFFVEMTEEDLTQGMDSGYWVQAWTAWAAVRMMVRQQRKGKIALVSSTLGYISYTGWASYTPAKQALRGLADTLHSECMLYGIDVHIFFPPTMKTDGYIEEMKTKPDITREIEAKDEGLTTEQAALAMFTGIQNNQAHITGEWITNTFRCCTRGAVPGNNWFIDKLIDISSWVIVPIFRMEHDGMLKRHRASHQEYLRSKGFFN
ncbi:3-dehydrosphinganine reductase [Marasmius crinis-equi]|uniref:3-dehydrosphinganine reductase n=1 Tax=Marasmius crinis-equi TaxID=585013 RepID=A0ABR3FHP7_9AGAR